MEVKLSDIVADFIVELGVKHVFVLQGGAVAHLIDSIAKKQELSYIAMQHEQSSAMAADSYSRVFGIGVAIATSGPGATNLITGIANAYYDSIPVLYITGNVASFRQSEKFNVRQYGFQENNIVDMVKSITKYAKRLEKPEDILLELNQAIHIATKDRKGPVLIDIPDDFQRVNLSKTAIYKDVNKLNMIKIPDIEGEIITIYEMIQNSKRPVLVFGAGVELSGALYLAKKLSRMLNIPVLHTWALKGLYDFHDKLNFGSFGTNSNRSGNFIVQNADLIIAIGTRLDTHATGSINTFAREAKIILNDIDIYEIDKFKILKKNIELSICADAKFVLQSMIDNFNDFEIPNFVEWIEWCSQKKKLFYPKIQGDFSGVNPYELLQYISRNIKKVKYITADTGANLAYVMCAYEEIEGQKFITAFNNTPMGYSLPAAIGVSFWTDKNEIIFCFAGDGGLQMNIQELATVSKHKLPIKIFVFNNYGHAMIKQTQDDWFDSKYEASSIRNGIPSINFCAIAEAYGIKNVKIQSNEDTLMLDEILKNDEPCLIEVVLDESLKVYPMLKYGKPIEDSNPLLGRDVLKENMIIKIYEE